MSLSCKNRAELFNLSVSKKDYFLLVEVILCEGNKTLLLVNIRQSCTKCLALWSVSSGSGHNYKLDL